MQLLEVAMESLLVDALGISATEEQLIDKSGLSEDEKSEARQTLRRFLRGAIDGDIGQRDFNTAVSNIANEQADGSWRLRRNVTDDQLKAFLSEAKKSADDAQIPEQPNAIDPSDEVKRVIDEALREQEEPPPDDPAAAEEDGAA